MHLCAVDREYRNAGQPRLRAEPEHLAEQVGDRALVALAKPRDRRVIRLPVGRDEPHRDVLKAAALDHPR